MDPLAGRPVNATPDPSFAMLRPRQRAIDTATCGPAILEYVWPLVARYTFADWLLTQSTELKVAKTPITQIIGYMTEYTSGSERMGEWRLWRKWWPGQSGA